MISSCVVTQRTSKGGKEYYTVDIIFSNGYKKVVFLDNAEQYMLKSLNDNSKERR